MRSLITSLQIQQDVNDCNYQTCNNNYDCCPKTTSTTGWTGIESVIALKFMNKKIYNWLRHQLIHVYLNTIDYCVDHK